MSSLDDRPTDASLRATLLALAAERGAAKSFCPSEAARRLWPKDWRARLPAVRAAAARLVAEGRLRATQGGRPVDPLVARGPIRLVAAISDGSAEPR